MRFLRCIAALSILVASSSMVSCASGSDDEFYQYRTVEYSVAVVGPHDSITVSYTKDNDIHEEHPTSSEWQTTVTGRFYEALGLDLQVNAYVAENSVPVPPKASCRIQVDGKTYEESDTNTVVATCHVDFDEVTTSPRSAPSASADGGSSNPVPMLVLGGVLVLAAVLVARWAYVRRRRTRGSPAGPVTMSGGPTRRRRR
jgi:hypothetical protein